MVNDASRLFPTFPRFLISRQASADLMPFGLCFLAFSRHDRMLFQFRLALAWEALYSFSVQVSESRMKDFRKPSRISRVRSLTCMFGRAENAIGGSCGAGFGRCAGSRLSLRGLPFDVRRRTCRRRRA